MKSGIYPDFIPIKIRKELIILENIINLDNNYYLKLVNNTSDIPIEVIKIQNLIFSKIIKKRRLLLEIDFSDLNKAQYKRILKKLLLIKRLIKKSNIGESNDSKIL